MVLFWYYWWMPPQIRMLIRELQAAGFVRRPGKGSHRKYVHPGGSKVTVSGKDNSDARHYQVRNIRKAIARVKYESK